MFVNEWESLGRVVLMAAFAYCSLILVLRLSGKRTLAKMNAFDLVVTVALGSTLATVVLSKDNSLAEGVVALASLVSLQFLVAWLSVRSRLVRRLVRGEPTLLLHRGEIIHTALRSQRVTESELKQAARAQGIADLSCCAVVLETDGNFSIVPISDHPVPATMADVPNRRGSDEALVRQHERY